MPIRIVEVDAARRRVYAVAEGPTTGADFRAHVEELSGRGLLEYAELLDCDHAAFDRVTGAEVRDLSITIARLGATLRLGPLAPFAAADVTYGLLRMYELLTDETHATHVARTRAEAEAWLDIVAGRP